MLLLAPANRSPGIEGIGTDYLINEKALYLIVHELAQFSSSKKGPIESYDKRIVCIFSFIHESNSSSYENVTLLLMPTNERFNFVVVWMEQNSSPLITQVN